MLCALSLLSLNAMFFSVFDTFSWKTLLCFCCCCCWRKTITIRNQTCCLCPHTPHLTFLSSIFHIFVLIVFEKQEEKQTGCLCQYICHFTVFITYIPLSYSLLIIFNPLHLDKTTCLLSALYLCMESTVKVSDQIKKKYYHKRDNSVEHFVSF